MVATVITVKDVCFFERPVVLRLPFKFGIVTLQQTPQIYLKVEIEDSLGNRAIGMTAELLVPKWFDKNKDLTNEQNVEHLRRAVGFAREAALETSGSAFAIHHYVQDSVRTSCAAAGLNMLVASFGVAQLDKAIMDALCRLHRLSFYDAIRANLPGLDDKDFYAGLRPLKNVYARHTVGLLDPLTASDVTVPVQDNLPQTLEEIIHVYEQRYFKIKVGGDLDADMKRLENIAALLPGDALVTLDGNEQYGDANRFLQLLDEMEKSPRLKKLRDAIMYIEQPIHRDQALRSDVFVLADRYPIILDESDDSDDVFTRGKALGYSGISSKACKGLYRSLQNAALAAKWNMTCGAEKYFLSAEDLTTQAGLAVQQDLALAALLGLTHVERNGHHYVDGMTAERSEANVFAKAHADLYMFESGRCRLKIKKGVIATTSLDCVGFASAALPTFDNQAISERKAAG